MLPPASVASIVDVVCDVVRARSGRLFVADYGLRSIRELGPDGPLGAPVTIEGTLQGRVFSNGVTISSGSDPTVLHVPLTDGTERIGLLELDFDVWDGFPGHLPGGDLRARVSAVGQEQVLRCVGAVPKSRVAARSCRSPVGLLPPLAASADNIAVAGILEPAYSIGGDSFDYALNRDCLDFAIVDAMGHGMSAVLMAAVAIDVTDCATSGAKAGL